MKRFSCDEWVELVTAYLESALDEPSRHRFEEHLADCRGCTRYLGQFRVTVETLGDLPPEPLRAVTRERLLSAFRKRRHSSAGEGRPPPA